MENILNKYLRDLPLEKKMLIINCDETDTMVICVSDKHNIKYEPVTENMKLNLIGEVIKNGSSRAISTVSINANPRMIENIYETYIKKFVDNYHRDNIDYFDEYSKFSIKYIDKTKKQEICLRIEDESGNKLN